MQVHIEYFFRFLYECLYGACFGSTGAVKFSASLAHLWLLIIIVGYALSVIGLFIIVYCMVRLFELRKREEEYYRTLIPAPDAESGGHPRWRNIEALIDDTTASKWREAIIEADIMLDDVLSEQGYVGDGVGEKLQGANKTHFSTLQDAWEAHKVRNQIAHEGSAFNLSEELARRTIARYENVFRELKAI